MKAESEITNSVKERLGKLDELRAQMRSLEQSLVEDFPGLSVCPDLIEENNILKTILDSGLQVYFYYDITHRKLIYVSHYFEVISGYSAQFVMDMGILWFIEQVHPDDYDRINAVFLGIEGNAIDFGQIGNLEFKWKTKSGRYIWLSSTPKVVVDESNDSLAITGTLLDISSLKKTQDKLVEVENQYKVILDSQSELVHKIDADLKIHFVNPAFSKLFNTLPEEMIGQNLREFISEKDSARVEGYVKRFTLDEPVIVTDDLVMNSQGEKLWIRWTGSAIFDENSQLVEIQIVGVDITELKSARLVLEEKQTILTSVLCSHKNTIITLVDSEGEYLFAWASPDIQQYFSIDISTLVGKKPYDILPNNFIESLVGMRDDVFASGESCNISRWVLIGDCRRYFDMYFSPVIKDGEVVWVSTFIRDITESKLKEDRVHYRIRFEQLITDIATHFINLPTAQVDEGINEALETIGKFVDGDRSYIFIVDHDKGEMSNSYEWCSEGTDSEIDNLQNIPNSYLPWWIGQLSQRKIVNIYEISELPKDAVNERTILESQGIKSLVVVPMISEGKLVGFMGVDNVRENRRYGRDITSLLQLAAEILVNSYLRTKAEQDLIRTEQQMTAVGENIQDSIIVWYPDGHIGYANKASMDYLGHSFDGSGMHVDDLLEGYPEFKELWTKRMQDVFETGHTMHASDHHSYLGKEIWADIIVSPMYDKMGHLFAAAIIYRDITERKKVELEFDNYRNRIFRTEQLASLGIVSASLAHELNQPLTVIRLFMQQAVKKLQDLRNCPAIVLNNLSESLGEVENATSIVNRFKSFSRKSSPVIITKHDLSKLVERIIRALEPSAVDAGIKVTTRGFKRLPEIEGNEGQFEQIFFILIQNAIQAASGEQGSKLSIKASVDDDVLKLEFKDTCGGISPENIDRIFEPFFTTKSPDKGTGLGLCILQKSVQGIGGMIEVKSKFGQGSTFIVTLPVSRKKFMKWGSYE